MVCSLRMCTVFIGMPVIWGILLGDRDDPAVGDDELNIEECGEVLEGVVIDGDDVGGFACFDGSDAVLGTDEFGCVDGCRDKAVLVGHSCFVHVDKLLGVCAVGSDSDIRSEGDVDAGFMSAGEGVLDMWSDGGGFGADGFGEVAINFGFVFDELSCVDCGDEVGTGFEEEFDG